ncbi:MAG TPA: hypothetical protein VIV11_31850 [Kofleriaceae bacterium]
MTRLALLVVVVVAGFGCATKPSEEDCRAAITNMQQLMGTENLRDTEMVESQVRRCKGGSNKKSVECAKKAQTLDELRKCDFYKVPDNAKGIGADPAGSAAGSGSAMGSDAAGSAGSGAPAGSAAPTGSAAPAAGSAAGSAAPTGSAASPGAAAGSAATSAGSAVGSAK